MAIRDPAAVRAANVLAAAGLTPADVLPLDDRAAQRRCPGLGRKGLAALRREAPVLVVTRHPALVELLRERGIVGPDVEVREHVTAEDVRGRHVVGRQHRWRDEYGSLEGVHRHRRQRRREPADAGAESAAARPGHPESECRGARRCGGCSSRRCCTRKEWSSGSRR